MSRSSDLEILIDPIVLSLVWSKFASDELRREREQDGEEGPTDLDDENYFFDTSTAIFGENQPYPLEFFKETLLFTTRIRTPFSGKKFIAFKEMLYDQVAPQHHDQLSSIRPLFDDPGYYKFRAAASLEARPWDLALMGFNPAELGYGAQDHLFLTSTASDLGQVVKRFFRLMNEDTSSAFLIEEIFELNWPDGEPIDFSVGFPQVLTDYLAIQQFSLDPTNLLFGLPYFSFNDASGWTQRPFATKHMEPPDEALQRNLDQAISITLPSLKALSFSDILDLRQDPFFDCYRTIVVEGGFQTLAKEDINEMLRAEILQATDDAGYGVKEIIIDFTKFITSFIPVVDKIVGIGSEAFSATSRFRRFKNRWLWFVKNARQKSGNLFRSLEEEDR